jgi:hypothetical protein
MFEKLLVMNDIYYKLSMLLWNYLPVQKMLLRHFSYSPPLFIGQVSSEFTFMAEKISAEASSQTKADCCSFKSK